MSRKTSRRKNRNSTRSTRGGRRRLSLLSKITFVLAVGLLCLLLAVRLFPDFRLPNLHELRLPDFSELRLPDFSEVFNRQPNLPDGEIWVHFIDVGQGDSILIHSSDHAVLIDAGATRAGPSVQRQLLAMNITRLDYVIATHPHSDHIGGLPFILDRFEVGEIWLPDAIHTTDTFERLLNAIERNNLRITTARAGDRLQAGVIEMSAVAPNRTGYDNINNYSIAMRMVYGNTAFLFTGDVESISENEIAAEWYIRADVLDVPHHGSRTSTTERFLDAVSPGIAVISSGAGNQFGHPHPEVLERLRERGVQILRTDELGTVSLMTDGERIFRLE